MRIPIIAAASLALAFSPWFGLAVPSYYSSKNVAGTGCPHKVKESIIPPHGWRKYAPAPSHHTITLRIALSQPQFSTLEQHLSETSDPEHSRYGAHLSKEEVDALSAPHPDSVRLVDEWLAGYGLLGSDINRSSSKDSLSFTVPVRLAEVMLDTEYHIWRHDDNEYILRTTSYSLPENLHDHIELVQPTTLFARWKGMKSQLFFEDDIEVKVAALSSPLMDVNNLNVLEGGVSDGPVDPRCNTTITISCLQQMYNFWGYKPQAPDQQQLGITGYLEQYANYDDLQEFYKAQRPDALTSGFEYVSVAGGNNNQSIELAGNEANLDVQYAFGITYPIHGVFWSTPGSPPYQADLATPRNTNEPYQVWLDHMSSVENPPAVISTSYGDSEQTVPESYARQVCRDLAKLTARGVSLIFASGDGGVGDGNPDPNHKCYSNDGRNVTRFMPLFPATCPYVTAVGGTNSYPEIAVYFSGGGFSNYFARPDYQKEVVDQYLGKLGDKYSGLYNQGGRAIPDVSAQGRHYAIHTRGRWVSIGGTSAAAPVFAAVVALLNDARLAQGKSVLGFLNPALYKNAIPGLNDITMGNNPGCGTNGFDATEGWDPITGLGTPDFGKLKDIFTGLD